MKNLFYIALLCLTFAACSREELPNLSSGNPASLILSINTMQNDVQTRAISPDLAEKRIFNLYVFVFNADGSIDYQKYHTFSSVIETKDLIIDGLTCGSGKSVAVVANIDNANTILNIKQATLDAITSRRELEALIVIMQKQSIERGTNFLTSGITENVTISADGATSATVSLKRVDAKIRFNITTPSGVVFTPSDWRVVNVPQKIRVMGSQPRLNLQKGDCFDTEWAKFEDGGATFAFYSMEHILTPKAPIPAIGNYSEQYALREKQDKTPTGQGNSVTNGDFTYAPLTGTYVEMRGNIWYKLSDGKEISADVVYTVHLGGVEGVNDYNTRRNTFYTYNVKIVSVNKIVIEVDSKEEENEQRPGGEGDVTEAQKIMNLDAYNEIFLLTFNQSQVDVTLTWSVYTPFSKGAATDNPLDYKWIYFRINSKTNPNQYSNNFQLYPGDERVYEGDVDLDAYMSDITSGQDRMLDVKQLMTILKESKQRSLSGNTNHLFDTSDEIKFTTFVSENYYETSPDGTSTAVDGFWKQFTNRQQRVMNILSDLKYSPDHESSKSNAVYSIRQHAIQTMYNRSLNENFTAWGTQMIQDETPIVFDQNNRSYVNTATDHSNGRKNTIELWASSRNWSYYITQTNWSMISNYNTAKYKCLRMNRDNDGDGTIDENEVQWYLAAINQLTDIWIGEWSYDPAARLYKKTTWEKHYVVSSTVSNFSGNILNRKDDPQILWASEGSSIGQLTGAEGDAGVDTKVYYRCVRNLGVPRNANIDTKPSELAEYDPSTHRISLRRLDAQSIRSYYQETEELPVHHEREASNKPYREFTVRTDVHGGSYTWQSLFDYTQAGNRLCPDGYRIPNQRELALMLSRIGKDGNWTLTNHFSRTSFSFSTPTNYRPGFSVKDNGGILFLTHGNATETGGVRCVKDYVQDKPQ